MRLVRLAAGLVLAAVSLFPLAGLAADAFTTGNVNIRTGPSTDYPRLGTLPAGVPVDVLGCTGGWCQVTQGGPPGWVSDNYLEGMRGPPPIYDGPPIVIAPPIVVAPPYYGPGYGPPPYYGRPGYRPPPPAYRPPPPGYRPPPPPPGYGRPGYRPPPPQNGGQRPPPPYNGGGGQHGGNNGGGQRPPQGQGNRPPPPDDCGFIPRGGPCQR